MEKTDIKVSYTILTHNETDSLKKLLLHLQSYITTWDEIIIVDDYSDNLDTIKILSWAEHEVGAKVFRNRLNRDFSAQKNFAISKCKNEYIFNLDADEIMTDHFMNVYKEILFINKESDTFRLPRINTVDGITLKHIEQWRWQITHLPTEIEERAIPYDSDEYKLLHSYKLILNDDKGLIKYLKPLVNYPDYQMRIHKRLPDIKWEGNVHERIVGYKTFSNFPMEKNYSILHHKVIDKQEQQNSLYDSIIQEKRNL